MLRIFISHDNNAKKLLKNCKKKKKNNYKIIFLLSHKGCFDFMENKILDFHVKTVKIVRNVKKKVV